MKSNPDEFKCTTLRNTDLHMLQFNHVTLKSNSSAMLLEITLDSKINFDRYNDNTLKGIL